MYGMPSPVSTASDSNEPIYPYGLCISFTEKELEKLNIESDASVGDYIHLHAIGKVTSVSERDTPNGPCCRVEVQLTAIAAEDESHEHDENDNEGQENEDAEQQMRSYKPDRSKFYK